MLKKISLIFLYLVLNSLGRAGQERSGGAGISHKDRLYLAGELVTKRDFSARGVESSLKFADEFSESRELTYEDLPELRMLVSILQELVAYERDSLQIAVSHLMLSKIRSYHFEAETSDEELANVSKIYSDLFKNELGELSDGEVTVLALTDKDKNRTALLKPYFNIKSLEARMAILYHDMLWSANNKISYEYVVGAEERFYTYLVRRRRALAEGFPSILDLQIALDLQYVIFSQYSAFQ